MYSSCLFCHTDLGRNERIESFPVGRRLAFDSANGRFWVICPSCKRWNLSPLEERWDAMDMCERLYEGTRRRMSTDNIGLARLEDGLELVRVGAAMRPEMAAWRFGEQLALRRRKYRWIVAGGVVAAAGLSVGLKVAGIGVFAGNWGWNVVRGAYERATRLALPPPASVEILPRRLPSARSRRVVESFAAAQNTPRVETKHARGTLIVPAVEDDATHVAVPVVGGLKVHYAGADAERVAAKLLAKVNRSGGSKQDEQMAVAMLERVADDRAPDLFTGLMRQYAATASATKPLKEYGGSLKLALEMSLQEQRERELLAGELLDLEFAWKEAEELARIADTLTPTSIDQALARLKARMDG